MHRITCPWCGPRDEIEFHYRGDATVSRPPAGAGAAAFYDYIYTRGNPLGWHLEWWAHAGGCRQWVKVLRNTATHEIKATGKAWDALNKPK
jgi:sarcosine oxidase subunit delta